ncbi:MAG TPA: hypothetical protein VJS37_17460, partial [Terriglobales bacterium]|nr:hypothetical protein [Terriglobales bacterium]
TSVAITSSHQIALWRNESTNFKLLAHRAHPEVASPLKRANKQGEGMMQSCIQVARGVVGRP